MASNPTSQKFTVHLINSESVITVRTILQYEARLRGRTIGQTCTELLLEAVDVDSYPPEVKSRLANIRREARRRAIEKSLSMVRIDDDGTGAGNSDAASANNAPAAAGNAAAGNAAVPASADASDPADADFEA